MQYTYFLLSKGNSLVSRALHLKHIFLLEHHIKNLFLCLAGKEGLPAATDDVLCPPLHSDLPDRWGHMEGTEGEESCPHGGHPYWGLCALLDPLLHHRAHQPSLLLWHPPHLEEHLPLARVLKFLFQPSDLYSLQQELQQCLQEPVLQAAVSMERTTVQPFYKGLPSSELESRGTPWKEPFSAAVSRDADTGLEGSTSVLQLFYFSSTQNCNLLLLGQMGFPF